MDRSLKVWVLLASGLLLWLATPALQLKKIPAVLLQFGSICCLIESVRSSKKMIFIEAILEKESILEGELIDSELAWKAENRERELQEKYLSGQTVSIEEEAQSSRDPREILEASYQLTNHLLEQLAEREKATHKEPEPKAKTYTPEQQLILEISRELGWISAKLAWQKKNALRKIGVEGIRENFTVLATQGSGKVRGQGTNLEFCINPENSP